MAERDGKAADANGGPGKERGGRDSPSAVKDSPRPSPASSATSALAVELDVLEEATVLVAARFIAAEAVSPWFEDALRGLIGQKVALRRVLAAVEVAEAEALPFPEGGAS